MNIKNNIILLFLLLVIGVLPLSAQEQKTFAIIPKPTSIQAQNAQFILSEQTRIVAKSGDTKKMVSLFNELLWNRYKLRLSVSTLDADENAIILDEVSSHENPEAYTLNVSSKQIHIKGANKGIFYALQSLLQLIESVDGTLVVPGVSIVDEPEFEYRGIMIDVARHFFSIDELKKIIDQMAYFKFNRLHWHLTDDQGWRLEIKKYPKLTQISAFRDSTIIGQYRDFKPFIYDGEKHGGYYTQDQARELVKYAADRQITIIPEIELPGHSTAVLAAYPELGNGPGPYKVPGFWGVHPTIYSPNEATFQFLENVLTEVIDIFPSKFIHIGGDEVPKDEWKTSAVAQKIIKKNNLKDEHELQSWFIQRIGKFLNKNGRELIGWDEILEGGLAPNATVMSWRGEKGGIAAAKMGHNVIMSPNSYMYIDYYQSENSRLEPLGIGGFLPIEKVYSYQPRPESLTKEQQKHIIGVQANLWTEYIATNNKLEYMLFPRVLAVAEVAWTGKNEQNYEEFTTIRLPKRLAELERENINYRIPEAKVEITNGASGRKTVTITPFVANCTVYYTIDGHIADNNGTLYIGPFELPHLAAEQKPLHLNYVIISPGNRTSTMFTVPFEEE